MKKIKAEALKTREYLMLSALDTFYQKGVSRSSLNEIAHNAGVTRGALYWHFKNKEDLFDALFQHIFSDINRELEQDIQNGSVDIWASFRTALLNVFDRIENNEMHRKFCNILHLKCEHTEQNQAIVSLMKSYQDMWRIQLSDTLNACLKQKSLPENLNIELAVIYLKSVISGLIDQWLFSPDSIKINDIAPAIIDISLSNLKENPLLLRK
ncbi:multidrug efflux system transcriptional repressor MtrR [Neisseria canis]|uniref:MtrCDE transcriptional repressor n=1 Tax=Neisseria canis TaxID=493 RepID=A0A448D9W2_9NEIS|nr:TetR family transcriptional regulator [Neisseria canis]OSI13042.1 TetR family transcriptional regulator [Neisseria canis]VEF02578.1 mtrCDE transcriptional repressor [Neisseria canis]